MYAVICDARRGNELGIFRLALVNRQKSKRYWWTSDSPGLVMAFTKKSAAEFQAKRYKMNRPRVVEYAVAVQMIKGQQETINKRVEEMERERDYHDAMESAEMGWDAHKTY